MDSLGDRFGLAGEGYSAPARLQLYAAARNHLFRKLCIYVAPFNHLRQGDLQVAFLHPAREDRPNENKYPRQAENYTSPSMIHASNFTVFPSIGPFRYNINMAPLSRRNFLLMAACTLPALRIQPRLQGSIVTIALPARDSLPDSLLFRVVDAQHPISAEEIAQTIEPHLQFLPLVMDGILVVHENVRVNQLCLTDLTNLFNEANTARTGLYIHSGFRSYEEQAYAYSHAKDKAVVMLPGTSQHHTGLALDFTSSEIGKVIDLYAGFEKTKAGIWLLEHAWEYGFLQSYTGNHDSIRAESWHYLYVGKPLAKVYRELKSAGWYGDVFLLQTAISLGMRQLVFDT